MATWSTQDAKARLSAVIDAAIAGEPQYVTRHGKPAVKIVAVTSVPSEADDPYPRFKEDGTPYTFVDHLLNFPEIPEGLEHIFDRGEIKLRDIEF